ncbi:MAG: hypothetical protein NW237_02145 [Cyanobacteriota bacterium]|nr:hypothetical protein [Cyanobacteriota bacterium]
MTANLPPLPGASDLRFDPIPAELRQRLGDPLSPLQWRPYPWLPFDWSLQVGDWGWIYASPEVETVGWAEALLRLRWSHPPIPWVRPPDSLLTHLQEPSPQDQVLLTFCWSLNRVVQAAVLDQELATAGYSPQESHNRTLDQICQHVERIPEFARVLLVLELLYREISIPQQQQLKAICGQDVMQAAYQMNMMCVDPHSPDRTLLQVQRIALKLAGEAEAYLRSSVRTQLSDGRIV